MDKKIGCIQFLENHAWLMQQCFRLTHYEIIFSDKPAKGSEKDWQLDSAGDCDLITRINYPYLRSEILVLKPTFDDYKRGLRYNIIQSLCHEITHIFTNKIWDGKKKNREYLEESTQHLSRLLMDNYDKWMEDKKVNYKTGIISNKK